ncbi:MAG: universal stress protein [Nitrososphaerales archaeon]
MVRNILVPVDSSKHSLKAAKLAIRLAKGLGAKITLIHVVEIHPYFSVPEYLIAKDEMALMKIRELVEGWLAKIERTANKENVNVRHEILIHSTSVVESIVTYSKRKQIDLIVMGTRGTSGLRGCL